MTFRYLTEGADERLGTLHRHQGIKLHIMLLSGLSTLLASLLVALWMLQLVLTKLCCALCVQAANCSGDSPVSLCSTYTTQATVPSQPGPPAVTATTPVSMQLQSWAQS